MTLWSALRASTVHVLGMNRRNLTLVLKRNPRWAFPQADDKLLCKEVLVGAGIPVAPTLTLFRSFHELDALEQRLRGLHEFVVKPALGRAGRGILVIAERPGPRQFVTAGGRVISLDGLRRHVGDVVFGAYSFDRADVAIVEPRLRPHPFFARLYPEGLSDLRLIVVDEHLLVAMARIPTRASDGRANLHQGALGLGIDLSTGAVHRAWHLGAPARQHPDTGSELVGLRVPCWGEILDLARRVAARVPLKYLGLDVVVDATAGPLVLEINARPGLEVQNVTGVPLRAELLRLGIEGEAP